MFVYHKLLFVQGSTNYWVILRTFLSPYLKLLFTVKIFSYSCALTHTKLIFFIDMTLLELQIKAEQDIIKLEDKLIIKL